MSEQVIGQADGTEVEAKFGLRKLKLAQVSQIQGTTANMHIHWWNFSESVLDYIAYTIKIDELPYKHPWASVLGYMIKHTQSDVSKLPILMGSLSLTMQYWWSTDEL